MASRRPAATAAADGKWMDSSGGMARIMAACCELGERLWLLTRGLFDLLLGDGVNGGLPGRDGAQTICSGVAAESLPATLIFSLPSMSSRSNPIGISLSPEMAEEKDNERSLCCLEENLRIERSNGIVRSDLLSMSAMLSRAFWCFASSSGDGVFALVAGVSGEAAED